MNRYTFTLLVCRVIGILSLLRLLEEMTFISTGLSPYYHGDHINWAGFPYVAVCFGAGIPLIGCIVGLRALRIAARFRQNSYWSPLSTPLALSTMICWYAVMWECYGTALTGLTEWRFHISFEGNAPPSALRSLYHSTGLTVGTVSELLRLLSGLVILAVLIHLAKRVQTQPEAI
jgi:hypothetical protein